MIDSFGRFGFTQPGRQADLPAKPPLKLSVRTLGRAIEEALMGSYTRVELETVLADELCLDWPHDDLPSDAGYTKRSLIQAYMPGWTVPQLAAFARRIVTELDLADYYLGELSELLAAYDAGGGVAGSTKNLIFAANGLKPEIVLRDAINNDIEIVANAEYCLVYEDSIPAEGLWFSHLVTWWREREQITATTTDREVGLALYERLAACIDSPAEKVIFDVYASRYRASFDIPALIPQVYLHYDPYDQRTRRASAAGTPLARQRMDFLLLFSDRRRVVIEVDGKQHYATGDIASPELYAKMVAEDRGLRLAGYEVYRFGGAELFNDNSKTIVERFFEQLADRMA